MAETVITARKLWLGGYNLSGDLRSLALDIETEGQDTTRFGQTARTALPGLLRVRLNAAGLYDSDGTDEPDDVIPAIYRTTGNIITVGAQTGAAGEVGWILRGGVADYRRAGSVGGLLEFDVSAFLTNSPGAIRATHLFQASLSGTGAQTGFQVGAIGAGQTLYAAIHCTAHTGTVSTRLESDDNAGFTSATVRHTFSNFIAPGAQWATVAGPVTDDYWRLNVTAGTAFVGVLSVGIL